MKFAKVKLLVVHILALGIFLIVNQMTPNSGDTSGNGNPALLIVWILIPILVFMVILWVRIFRMSSISNTVFIISIFGILVHLTVSFFYQKNELNEYREVIRIALLNREGVADAQYMQVCNLFSFVGYCIYSLEHLGKERKKPELRIFHSLLLEHFPFLFN
ncbi:hypothetical protein [Lysinibacillus xylanilyticus]|uniref:hypothetical protein n=1 Tax=Lysinibacillus xylanilyticus TaxID=582475 RepID=UPI00083C9269|nr:hypothetical protein [Lysinibacillus xylanilyticus]